MKTRLFAAAVAAMAISAGLSAQNINPTVEVVNTYEGRLLDVHKPLSQMAVPDSLLAFRLDFDYDVFDTPYKGAYDFEPYLISMRPTESTEPRRFFLKAGAGYTLRPSLGFVYSAPAKGIQWDVYGSFNSYFGDYHRIAYDSEKLDSDGGSWNGHDMAARIGFNGQKEWKDYALRFGAAYDNLSTKDWRNTKSSNGGMAFAGIRSLQAAPGSFYYDGTLRFSYRSDAQKTSLLEGKPGIGESLVNLGGELGPVLDASSRLLFGVNVDMAVYSGLLSSFAGRIALTPKYVFNRDRWNFSLGLALSALVHSDDTRSALAAYENHSHKGQFVYPMVNVEYSAVPGKLALFASATGGDDINAYSSMQEGNHHFDPIFGLGFGPLLDNTSERINVRVGAKGGVMSRLHYEVFGGVSIKSNAPMEMAYELDGLMAPGLIYHDVNLYYAGTRLNLETSLVDAGAELAFKSTNLRNSTDYDYGFLPSKISGNLYFRYKWQERLSAGFDAGFASSRDGCVLTGSDTDFDGIIEYSGSRATIPGWLNLGIRAEYRLNRRLGLWIRGGNLLGQKIQRNVLYAEKGVSVTGGVIFNL